MLFTENNKKVSSWPVKYSFVSSAMKKSICWRHISLRRWRGNQGADVRRRVWLLHHLQHLTSQVFWFRMQSERTNVHIWNMCPMCSHIIAAETLKCQLKQGNSPLQMRYAEQKRGFCTCMKKNQTAFLKLCLAGALIKLMEIQKSDTINMNGSY